MNHNNIYSILGKLESIEPKVEAKPAEPEKVYESVESRGSILEGVGSVEQRLNEKYQGFQKSIEESGLQYYTGKKKYGKDGMAALAKAGREGANQEELGRIKDKYIKNEGEEVCAECGMAEGTCSHSKMEEKATTHKGGEVSHKDGVTKHTKKDFPGYPADDINADDEDENKGKRGRPRKHAKKVDTGEKKGRGRPKKDKAPEYSKSHDPFGRVKAGAEKAGKDIKGKKHSMDEVAPPGEKAERMVKHIKKAYSKDGKLTPKEKAIAYATTWKAHNRGTVEENLSRIQRRLTEGVNFAELLREKQQTVDEMLAELSNDIKVFKETGHCSELLRDCMEIKGYHGKMVADEAAKVPGPDLGGIPGNVPLPDKMAKLTPPKPGIVGAVKDVAKGLKNFVTGKPDSGSTYEEVTLEDELNELAKLAGLNTEGNAFTGKLKDTPKGGKFELDGKEYTDTSTLDEEPNEGNAFTGKLAQTKKGDKFELDGKTFTDTSDLDEDKIDVEEAPEATNKPRPKYATLKHITTQGDDLHREKSQNPGHAAKGDNPLTNKLALEDRLAAEYESIKKVS